MIEIPKNRNIIVKMPYHFYTPLTSLNSVFWKFAGDTTIANVSAACTPDLDGYRGISLNLGDSVITALNRSTKNDIIIIKVTVLSESSYFVLRQVEDKYLCVMNTGTSTRTVNADFIAGQSVKTYTVKDSTGTMTIQDTWTKEP